MDELLKSGLRRAAVGFALGLLAGTGILWLANPGAFADGPGRWPCTCSRARS